MGMVRPFPSPVRELHNRALPHTAWGAIHGWRRAKYIVAWRQNRQYSARFRKARFLLRLRRELHGEKKKDHDKPKDVAQDGIEQLPGADLPSQITTNGLKKHGVAAARAAIKEKRFVKRYTSFKQLPRMRYSRELLRACTSNDRLPVSVQAMEARYDKYERKEPSLLQVLRKTTTIWQVSKRFRFNESGNIRVQFRRKKVPPKKFNYPSVARLLRKLELLQASPVQESASYRYVNPAKPLRLFSTYGQMFDSVLPRISREWIQEHLRMDESDSDIGEPSIIEVQRTPMKEKRMGKFYKAVQYRKIGGKLVALARNVRLLPDTTWRHLVRVIVAKLMSKQNGSNVHGEDGTRAFALARAHHDITYAALGEGLAFRRALLQVHHRRLRMSLQGRAYAAGRLEGIILDDPNPMPYHLTEDDDIRQYYEALEMTEGFVGLDYVIDTRNRRRRAEQLWVQTSKVRDITSDQDYQIPEIAENFSILNNVGEGSSSAPPGMLKRCELVDFDALREANAYESEEIVSSSDIGKEPAVSSRSSVTIRGQQCHISKLSSDRSLPDPIRNEKEKPKGTRMSVESRLLELAESENLRKLELAKEISKIGSGVLVQDEFKGLVSLEIFSDSPDSLVGQDAEIFETPELPRAPRYDERNHADTAWTRPSERQEKFPDFQLYHRSKSLGTDHDESMVVPHEASFLGSGEEETAMKKTLEQFNKNGVQQRGTFARGKAVTVPRRAPIGLDLSNNPDFSIGPPRKRFNTNGASVTQGQAATLTKFAPEGRQDLNMNNFVHKPTNLQSNWTNSRQPALGKQFPPGHRPSSRLRPLKLLSQQAQSPSRDHCSFSTPYRPGVIVGNAESGNYLQQSHGLSNGIGLGLAMDSQDAAKVPDTLRPRTPEEYASRSAESSRATRKCQRNGSQQSAESDAVYRVQSPGTIDSHVDSDERERIEGNNWKPPVPRGSSNGFQLFRPRPGEVYPDYQRRMFKPRGHPLPMSRPQAPTVPMSRPQPPPAPISRPRARPLLIIPAPDILWARARDQRIGLGLVDGLSAAKNEVDEDLSYRPDDTYERALMRRRLYSSHVGDFETEVGVGAGADVDVLGRRPTRRFGKGTSFQPLRLGDQIGTRPGENLNPNMDVAVNAGTTTTTVPQATIRSTEAQICHKSNLICICNGDGDGEGENHLHHQHQNNTNADADSISGSGPGPGPHPHTCIDTEAIRASISGTPGPGPELVARASRFPRPRQHPAGPRPIRIPPPLPSPPLRKLPRFRLLPRIPVRPRPSSPFPLLSIPLPLASPSPSSDLYGPKESTASTSSTGSDPGSFQTTITPRTALFHRQPYPPIPSDLLLTTLNSPNSSILPTSTTLDLDMENNRLTVRSPEVSQIRLKAMDDARQMQAKVMEECKKLKKEPPPYVLEELIGKGSFGRVYKGKSVKTAAVVAVKIIDIDESDTINPRNADSYSDFLKEINALQLLGEKNAKNINLVIEALPVNQAMWMITEFCGGGSVATLMKPTAPGGLNEKWIIPILREVAEAIVWVHEAGIIHRDIKCANVLVTEEGNVQLCDFGVAGMIEGKLDKRSTIIGTPHWMAPELFEPQPSYGSEVDIWAFGSMVYEVATGLPPNVANGVSYDRLGSHLQNNTPRLEGGNYSNNLRRLVAFCLEEDPKARPTIDQIRKHPYLLNTSSSHPTSTLKALVGSFKVWESRGGSRGSLFIQHGAQATPALVSQDDEWNFNGTEYFEDNVWGQYGVKDVIEAYGPEAVGFSDETTRPTPKVSKRRPPPEALSRLPAAPLEKLFDPNTLTSYVDNSTTYYGRAMPQLGASDKSDLPLRDDSAQISIRDTMIDLGGHDPETGLSSFPDMDTIKAGRRGRDESEDEYNSTLHDFSRPALSDPAETNNNRRTQDWKFPSMAPPASADPELSRFPTTYEVPRPLMTPGSGGRPALIHHPTEPLGAFSGGLAPTVAAPIERLSMRESLIDLDMSMPEPIPDFRRPSTANSDVGSATSEQMTSANPFELERHASLYQPIPVDEGREPSIYVSDETALPPRLRNGNVLQELAEMSDFSASDAEGSNSRTRRDMNGMYEDSDDSYYVVNPGPNESRESRNRVQQYDGTDDRDYLSMPPPPVPSVREIPLPRSDSFPTPRLPDLPAHPSHSSLTGSATQIEMATEITRIVAAMNSQLEAFKDIYDSSDVLQRSNSNRRIDRPEAGAQ